VSVYDKIGTFHIDVSEDGRSRRMGGNVTAFFCTPNGYVIHAAAGPRTAEGFLAEAKWALATYTKVLSDKNVMRAASPQDQFAKVSSGIRRAHFEAYNLFMHPDGTPSGRELVLHEPPADPRLRGLDEMGKRQRKFVHQLLMTRAYEPLARLGPVVYGRILGEMVTSQPVFLTGVTEAKQAGNTGQSLFEFYNEGRDASDEAIETPPPVKEAEATPPPSRSYKVPPRPSRR
jgi:hypothetical protein